MVERKNHILKPTTGNNRPTSVLFLDTETANTELPDGRTSMRLKLGVAKHYRGMMGKPLQPVSALRFTTQTEVLDWITKRCAGNTSNYLVSHNLIFDLTIIGAWAGLVNSGWRLESFYTKGTTSIFRWSKGKTKIIGLDNGNFFSGTLESWGKVFGLEKMQVDFATVNESDLFTYCERDVDIMVRCWQTWLEFLDNNECGSFKVTVGSTAYNTWRKNFCDTKIVIHDNRQALEIERESYRGARTECFYQGRLEGDTYRYVDVNNMYGYVLSRYEFPTELLTVIEHPTYEYLCKKIQRYNIVARVALRTQEPIFPYTYKGHACYPVGEFDTTLTTPELLYAISHNYVIGVGRLAVYKSRQIFRDYILYFYNLRQEYRRAGNTGMAAICKLLNNSLYGKFGQTGMIQKRVGDAAIDDIWVSDHYNAVTRQYGHLYSLAGGVFEEYKQGEAYNSFPAIAAHVTAYARMYLYNLIAVAGRANCFYCDTDSLIVNSAGWNKLLPLVSDTELGMLKCEVVSPWCIINSPKDYSMEGRQKVKGVSKKAIQLDDNTYQQKQWGRMAGMIRNSNLSDYTIRDITKHQNRVIYSGLVQPSGVVLPFELAESSLSHSLAAELLPVQPS